MHIYIYICIIYLNITICLVQGSSNLLRIAVQPAIIIIMMAIGGQPWAGASHPVRLRARTTSWKVPVWFDLRGASYGLPSYIKPIYPNIYIYLTLYAQLALCMHIYLTISVLTLSINPETFTPSANLNIANKYLYRYLYIYIYINKYIYTYIYQYIYI